MTQIEINGLRFEVNTAWAIDVVVVDFSSVDGGPSTDQRSCFNTFGPNAGNGDLTNGVWLVWGDSQIVVAYDETAHPDFVRAVTLMDITQTQSVTFDVVPDAPTNIVVPPSIEILSAFVGQINKNDSSGIGSIIPAEIGSAFGEPGVGLQVSYNSQLDADIGKVRVVTSYGDIDFSPPTGFGSTFGTDIGSFLVSDGYLYGAIVYSVQLLDLSDDVIDTFDVSPDQEIYDVSSASFSGTQLTIQFDGPTDTGAASQVNVGELLVSGSYAWSGAYTPVSAQVVQWDDEYIIIDDPVNFTGPNIASTNLLQILGQGFWAAYNAQIPW